MFTKGKWEAVCMGSEGYNIYARVDKKASDMTREEWLQNVTPIARLVLGGVVEQEPNARLISASPDLYEALKEMVSWKDAANVRFPSYAMEQAGKALAKVNDVSI